MSSASMTQVELFSGCGGMALGLARAGFETLAHVEKDEAASSTFQYNFNRLHGAKIRQAGDITSIFEPKRFLDGLIETELDLLAGGPPCQAYSKAGRGKLASLAGNYKNAHLHDSRGQLYKDYLKFVRDLKPKAVLMENVPDIMNYGGENLAEVIAEDLEDLGYQSAYTVLNAAAFGVPQYRERWFLIAYRSDLGVSPEFPVPVRSIDQFAGSAFSPILTLKKAVESGSTYAILPPVALFDDLPKAVSTAEAIDDLPVTSAFWGQPLKAYRGKYRFCKRLNDGLPYSQKASNEYQVEMRRWIGVELPMVTANSFRQTDRDFPIFARMKPDDRYREAIEIASVILMEKAKRLGFGTKSIRNIRELTSVWLKEDTSQADRDRISRTPEGRLLAETVPPYNPTQFLDKWRVLNPTSPAHTVVAHLSVDTYSHIHYDPAQARAVTVREAARLQSFPDGFLFPVNMGSAFKQIGNAVPPLLAFELGKKIADGIGVKD